MARYIDADKFEMDIVSLPYGYRGMVRSILSEQPTADVVEVRHGKDVYYEEKGWHCEFKCSVCSATIGVVECGTLDGAKFSYCPNCGAKLESE